MNVTATDKDVFCESGGCGEHTKAVLTCIHLVKRDYKFANKATVHDLNFTITHGRDFGNCSIGISVLYTTELSEFLIGLHNLDAVIFL